VAIGVDVVVGEGIATAVNLVLVDDAAVVVGRVDSVVLVGAGAGLVVATVDGEGGTVEGGAQAGDDSHVDFVVTLEDAEGAGVAAPDVNDVGLGVATVVTFALELVTLDLALDLAGVGLG